MTIPQAIQSRITAERAIPEKDAAGIYTPHGIDAAARRKVWEEVLKIVAAHDVPGGHLCTKPDDTDCHAHSGSRCMNGFVCKVN
ncbi:MAG TPA: hypothetical protein DCS09_08860 [Porphyromonadaceae bacterium]|nr:hypothetical protein [Porphyromonadaceae bacterium]